MAVPTVRSTCSMNSSDNSSMPAASVNSKTCRSAGTSEFNEYEFACQRTYAPNSSKAIQNALARGESNGRAFHDYSTWTELVRRWVREILFAYNADSAVEKLRLRWPISMDLLQHRNLN